MTQNEIAERYSQKLVDELLAVPHPQGKAYRIILDAITEALSLKGEEVYSREDMKKAWCEGALTENPSFNGLYTPEFDQWLQQFDKSHKEKG